MPRSFLKSKCPQEIREASGLRPLERRFRAGNNFGRSVAFVRSKSGAKAAAVQTLRDQRTIFSPFGFALINSH
jgi:hypothetical protein